MIRRWSWPLRPDETGGSRTYPASGSEPARLATRPRGAASRSRHSAYPRRYAATCPGSDSWSTMARRASAASMPITRRCGRSRPRVPTPCRVPAAHACIVPRVGTARTPMPHLRLYRRCCFGIGGVAAEDVGGLRLLGRSLGHCGGTAAVSVVGNMPGEGVWVEALEGVDLKRGRTVCRGCGRFLRRRRRPAMRVCRACVASSVRPSGRHIRRSPSNCACQKVDAFGEDRSRGRRTRELGLWEVRRWFVASW
jgi:hypothetical protein